MLKDQAQTQGYGLQMVAGSPEANGKVSPYSRPLKSVPMNDGPLTSLGTERIYSGKGVSLAGGNIGSYE